MKYFVIGGAAAILFGAGIVMGGAISLKRARSRAKSKLELVWPRYPIRNYDENLGVG
jgi:hypothetical protein